MRNVGAVVAALLGVSCTGKIHVPVFEVSPALKAVRVDANVSAGISGQSAEPPAPVPLVGADVVEFFGVPLEGAQDVVFVLDRSGSMADPALGRLATIEPYQSAPLEPETSTEPAPAEPEFAPPAEPPEPPPPVEPATTTEPPTTLGPATTPPPALRKIDVARFELLAALDQLPSGTRLNVVFFNDTLEAFAPSVGLLNETTRPQLAGFIQETEPQGSTALATAMRLAFVMKAKRVVLLSDGLGNIGGNTAAVLRDAREAMLGGVRIDAIGLGVDQNAALLESLARESGGLYQAL